MDTAEENVNQRVALPDMDELFNWNSAFVFYEIIFRSTFLWNTESFKNLKTIMFILFTAFWEMVKCPLTPQLQPLSKV